MMPGKKKKKQFQAFFYVQVLRQCILQQSVRRQSMVPQLQPVCVQKQDTVTQRDPLAEKVGEKFAAGGSGGSMQPAKDM